MDSFTGIDKAKLDAIKNKAKADPGITRPKRQSGNRRKKASSVANEILGTGEDYEYYGKVCESCGWCDDPDNCVWGITCPKCGAEPKQHCNNGQGKLEGLHEERWEERERIKFARTIKQSSVPVS